MHRTQILLDDADYLALKEAARQSGQSMGEIIRHYVSRGLRVRRTPRKRRRYRLTDLKGIFNDPGCASVHHDKLLYDGEL